MGCDVLAFLDAPMGPIDGIEGAYLGDDRVGNGKGVIEGLPDGTYTDGKVEIDYRLGQRVETAFSQIVNLLPGVWTNSHRGDGVVTGMVTWQPVKAENYTKYYPKGQPDLSLVGRWLKVYDWRDPSQVLTDPLTWAWDDNPVLGYCFYKLVNEGRQPSNPMTTTDGGGAVIVNPAWLAEIADIVEVWT